MVEPSGSHSRAVCPSLPGFAAAAGQQHQFGCMATQDSQQDKQQQVAGMAPQQLRQQGQQLLMSPSIAAQASSMQRLGGALQGVLSSGLATDFVEGLRPVMVGGTLQISTHIQLAGEAAPVFIGMFPSLQMAVDAQKQSQALVGKLPAPIARKLIEAQLAHTLAVAGTAAAAAAAAGTAPHDAPGRLLSAMSDTTGVTGPRFAAGHEASTSVPCALQQEQQSPLSAETDPTAAAQQQGAVDAGEHGSHNSPTAAAASSAQAEEATPAAAPAAGNAAEPVDAAAAVAAASHAPAAVSQPLAALTDDVINLLLRKGLHALAVVQGGQGNAEPAAMPTAGEQLQDAAGASAAVGLPTQDDVPFTAAGRVSPLATAAAAAAAAAGKADPAAAALGGYQSQQQQQQEQQQPYARGGRGLGAHGIAAPAAAGAYQGQYGAALDPLVEYAAPHTQQYPVTSQGMPPHPQLQDAAWAAAAMQQQLASAALASHDGYAHAAAAAAAAMVGYGGKAASYGMPDAAAAAGGAPADWAGYAAGGAGAQLYPAAGAPAAAAAAAAAGSGGDDLKRKRGDPRLNCIKSVQYRVSRFPRELHDMCVEHWERSRCARVVCNGVAGVMSVQGGRCVVSFSQAGQEVLKGVADYLRYAGEDRIKKWRRHVRMADFLRPNNRSGELMTAEEFLCVVGYQSEQGGGKKPKYMASTAEAAGSE